MIYSLSGKVMKTLINFINYLNSVASSIKFTHEISTHSVNFLDTTVLKDNQGNIITDVYQKPTDTHPYLHRTSAHRPHLKRSIPYSQPLRFEANMLFNRHIEETNPGIFGFLCSVWLCTTQSSPRNAESANIDSRGMFTDQRT